MIKPLQFVRGAVAEKDSIPVLKGFHVYDGRIQGTNGRLTIDAPCPKLAGLNFTVDATPFLRAVDICEGEPELTIEPGKLRITKGKFNATLPLLNHDDFTRQEATGHLGNPGKTALIPHLKALLPFVGEDASRAWACGILFRDGKAFATNNVIAASVPAPVFDETLNLPFFLAQELVRIGQEPAQVVAEWDEQAEIYRNVTFTYPDGSWIKSALLSSEWPDISQMLPTQELPAIPAGLRQAVERLLPFCPDKKNPVIKFDEAGVSTADGDSNARIEGYELAKSAFRSEPLLSVLKQATALDLSSYPQPCPFSNASGLRGILIGVMA